MAKANYEPKERLKKLLSDPQVRSWRLLFHAFQGIYHQLESELNEVGSSVPRFQMSFVLYFEGAKSAAELSRRLFVTRGNMSTFIKRLLKDEVIRVCPYSPSPKRPFYILTEVAFKNFENLFPRHVKKVKTEPPPI